MNDVPRRKPGKEKGPDLLQSLSGTPGMSADPPPRPRPLKTGPFGVLDVGSTKVSCLIGRVDGDGVIRVIGSGLQASRGVRAGGIVDLDAAEQAMRRALADAEEMASHRLR